MGERTEPRQADLGRANRSWGGGDMQIWDLIYHGSMLVPIALFHDQYKLLWLLEGRTVVCCGCRCCCFAGAVAAAVAAATAPRSAAAAAAGCLQLCRYCCCCCILSARQGSC